MTESQGFRQPPNCTTIDFKNGFALEELCDPNESGNHSAPRKIRLTFVHSSDALNFSEGYEGNWFDNKPSSQGTYNYVSGAVYSGEWKDGLHHGKGRYLFPDGSYYEGEWRAHKMEGLGLYVDVKGKKWEGVFVNGCYSFSNQSKLKKETYFNKIKNDFIQNAKEFVQNAIRIFTVEKKSMKEQSKGFFLSDLVEGAGQFVEPPYFKFEDKKPDVW